MQQGDQVNKVVLLIMNVLTLMKGILCTVFWDLGSSSNFVREAFAKMMGFKGIETRLCVTTLAGVVTDYTVIKYKCCIRDANNELYYFEAYGLECVTGALSTLDSSSIKRLFPNLSEKTIQSLQWKGDVDYLIGAEHPS